ncbi:hypothetical protein RRF57_008822 [Xylaria bambusicola]|uniref:Uncharacterized protein n=1 Tax=Xylaria bambusicola TaxID=326684 RepID=A0AAN7UU01_9PEZI
MRPESSGDPARSSSDSSSNAAAVDHDHNHEHTDQDRIYDLNPNALLPSANSSDTPYNETFLARQASVPTDRLSVAATNILVRTGLFVSHNAHFLVETQLLILV